MTAIFFKSEVATDQAPPSDLIIPVSARQGASDSPSHFTLPAQEATNTVVLPRNARRAVFSVSATGQASEEFWWSNVLQDDVGTFNSTAGPMPGLSPFREVQVLVDGQLAGVQWPFPVLFTGGVAPALHRPVVGIHAFDLREHAVDITPFLPLLCDGAPHAFSIRVAGIDGPLASPSLTDAVNDSWYVTGKLFLWLDDDPASVTTGDPPVLHTPPPIITLARALATTADGTANSTLTFTTAVRRTLRISTLRLATQRATAASVWTQALSYTNNAAVAARGFAQRNDLLVAGEDRASSSFSSFSSPSSSSSSPAPPDYRAAYRYPLRVDSAYAVSPRGNLSIRARMRQGKTLDVEGPAVFATGLEAFAASSSSSSSSAKDRRGAVARLHTVREGTAEFRQTGDGRESTGWGDMRQVFWFGAGGEEELYFRDVTAVNGSVVADRRRLAGRPEVVVMGSPGEEVGAALFAQAPVRRRGSP